MVGGQACCVHRGGARVSLCACLGLARQVQGVSCGEVLTLFLARECQIIKEASFSFPLLVASKTPQPGPRDRYYALPSESGSL